MKLSGQAVSSFRQPGGVVTLPAHIALPQRLLRPALASRSCFSRQPARLKDFKLRPHATASAKAKTSFTKEAADLQELATRLHSERGAQDKVKALLRSPRVRSFWSRTPATLKDCFNTLSPDSIYALLCLPAIGQHHILQVLPEGQEPLMAALGKLADSLLKADAFYSSLGGLVGYQAKCLELISSNNEGTCPSLHSDCKSVQFHVPQGPNLDGIAGRQIAAKEASKGLEALPHMAEIWPLGGAGDRLGLECEVTGKSVPTAMLPYCGRTLLEGLMRDLQARESLYFKLYGAQCTTPIVIMTSEAKDNHRMVLQTLEAFNWFGRGEENFRVICQPLVPVISASSGKWILPEPLAPLMKPGGHGALWKLMLDEGVFAWLSDLDRQAALIRQISNPMAGTDATMLALTGAGYADGRTFGFATCERRAGATEGVNVLAQRQLPLPGGGFEYAYNMTNLEYTEFERYGISDQSAENGTSLLPANTNILYVSVKAAEAAVKAGVAMGGGAALPGMIFNSNKSVSWIDPATGKQCKEQAGRMECTMQNLVDSLAQRFQEPIPVTRHAELNTFVVFNKRRRVTSSAKKRRIPGSNTISQTPDGSFLDLMHNAAEVLQRCSVSTPKVGNVEQYLEDGPGFIFLFHPGLGPLWDVIAQKIRGGALSKGSELVLEVAEAAVDDLRLDGSLIIEADGVYGRPPASAEDPLASPAPFNPGPRVRFSQSVRAPIQYSQVIPDLSEATGMVVPLRRRGPILTVGGQASWDTDKKPAEGLVSESSQGNVRTIYSSQCSRVRLSGVVIKNRGIDWENNSNVFWQHKVKRHEQVRIILRGQSEFEAANICLMGSHTFEVPDGYKMVVSASPGGSVRRVLSPLTGRRPSWQWRYLSGSHGALQLQMEAPISSLPGVPLTSRPLESEAPFTYMI